MRGFYQLPKALFGRDAPQLGLAAKVLYAMILDRLSLSERNRWTDEAGNTFALFAREEMAAALGVSRPTATKAFTELKAAGLVEEVQKGRNRPSRLYVADGKKFADSKNLSVSKNLLPEGKNLSAEGKKLSPEGKKLYTNKLNEQTDISNLMNNECPPVNSGNGQANKDINPPYQKIVQLYHENCPGLPRVHKLTDKRRRAIKARWRELNKLEEWKFLFQKTAASRFLMGENDRGWRADLDFLLREDKMTAIFEGKYDNQRPQNKGDLAAKLYRQALEEEQQEEREEYPC